MSSDKSGPGPYQRRASLPAPPAPRTASALIAPPIGLFGLYGGDLIGLTSSADPVTIVSGRDFSYATHCTSYWHLNDGFLRGPVRKCAPRKFPKNADTRPIAEGAALGRIERLVSRGAFFYTKKKC